ncbi:MAG: biotin/lipoyl-containing protein, partial [Bacteroidia bacterium]
MSLEIKVPPVGESITEVVLSRWVKNDGDFVEMDEIIAELESDKATFELTAEQAGTLKTVASEGDTLAIGAVVCTIEEGGAAATPKAEEEKPKAEAAAAPVADKTSAPAAESYATGTPSPSAAKILAEKGVDAGAVKGTGVDGRITKDDANKAASAPAKAEAPKASAAAPVAAPGSRNERREKMSPLRKTVAKRLVTVKNETAMLT